MAINYSDVLLRQPELSYAGVQYFYLVFDKLPGMVYNVQQVQLPSISIGETDLPNRLNPTGLFMPGDRLEYGTLDVTFLIEKDFANYRSILRWLKAMTNPEAHEQFKEWVEDVTSAQHHLRDDYDTLFSDATLIGADASNRPQVHWTFKDIFPVSLDGVQFNAANQEAEYLVTNSSFRFSYFTNQTYTDGAVNDDLI